MLPPSVLPLKIGCKLVAIQELSQYLFSFFLEMYPYETPYLQ